MFTQNDRQNQKFANALMIKLARERAKEKGESLADALRYMHKTLSMLSNVACGKATLSHGETIDGLVAFQLDVEVAQLRLAAGIQTGRLPAMLTGGAPSRASTRR